jgi:putative phosphoesterase
LACIGLLSDSHGRAARTARAIRLLIDRGADRVIHLGDVGSVEVIDALVERADAAGRLTPPVHLVFGNCDWDAGSLGRYARSLGIAVDDPVGRLSVDGRVMVYQHGHRDGSMDQALAEQVDYLCHGHSHRRRDERTGPTRLINPGALFRAAHYTVAMLDVGRDALRFYDVPD